jgi:hypothetical protein
MKKLFLVLIGLVFLMGCEGQRRVSSAGEFLEQGTFEADPEGGVPTPTVCQERISLFEPFLNFPTAMCSSNQLPRFVLASAGIAYLGCLPKCEDVNVGSCLNVGSEMNELSCSCSTMTIVRDTSTNEFMPFCAQHAIKALSCSANSDCPTDQICLHGSCIGSATDEDIINNYTR